MAQIIAIGGGGLSMEPDELALDRYVLEQTGKPRPAVCYLPTAAGDSPESIVEFYAAYAQLDCRPAYLALFGSIPPDLESFLLGHDVIYVGGGRTQNLLALWREWGLGGILRTALERGVILAGVSAGAVCWFEQSLSPMWGRLGVLEGLGFLPGSCCVHYDARPERRELYHELLGQGQIAPGYGLEDGTALHFVDGQLHRVVRSREHAAAYALEWVDGQLSKRSLESRYLLPAPSLGGDAGVTP